MKVARMVDEKAELKAVQSVVSKAVRRGAMRVALKADHSVACSVSQLAADSDATRVDY